MFVDFVIISTQVYGTSKNSILSKCSTHDPFKAVICCFDQKETDKSQDRPFLLDLTCSSTGLASSELFFGTAVFRSTCCCGDTHGQGFRFGTILRRIKMVVFFVVVAATTVQKWELEMLSHTSICNMYKFHYKVDPSLHQNITAQL